VLLPLCSCYCGCYIPLRHTANCTPIFNTPRPRLLPVTLLCTYPSIGVYQHPTSRLSRLVSSILRQKDFIIPYPVPTSVRPEPPLATHLMEFPVETSHRSAMFSAQNMQQMQPVAPRVQVSNSQLTGSNAAGMNRAPALNRGLGANHAFAPFQPAANVSISTRLVPSTVSAHMVSSITIFGHHGHSPIVYINVLSLVYSFVLFLHLSVLHIPMAKTGYLLTRSFPIEPQPISSPNADSAGFPYATQRIHPLRVQHALARSSRHVGSGVRPPSSQQ
jgi:hypothetical protein